MSNWIFPIGIREKNKEKWLKPPPGKSSTARYLCRVHITNKFHTWKLWVFIHLHMGVSENRGTPKSSILIGFSIINHPFWGIPIFGNTHIC